MATCVLRNLNRSVLVIPRRFETTISRPDKQLDEIIRVDHAGEFGADRIYAGQMAILGNTKIGPKINEMWQQEKQHRAKFEELINKHRVRPTALLPIWDIAGFALGAGSALLGTKGAMACTVAVESVIVEHYNEQIRQLLKRKDADLSIIQTIKQFRDEEQEHHDAGIQYGAMEAPFYDALTKVIQFGCKTAIELSKII
uniref:5-demethoxyubiquinone hydroxylase, mitochondrial n=1 Tax=Panstrongylus megistus TaxID=65343 RepID=A0A069DQE5_9HEMI